MPENVIPETEINRRRRVNELADIAARYVVDMIDDNKEHMLTLSGVGEEARSDAACDWPDFIPLVIERCPEGIRDRLRLIALNGGLVDMLRIGPDGLGKMFAHDPSNDDRAEKMQRLVKRLFAEAPKMEGADDQAPAVECQIVLRSGYQARGALSTTPEGLLRFLAIANSPKGAIALEHFFDYEDLEAVMMFRGVGVEQPKSSIITG